MYAVIAPGLHGVYSNYSNVEDILAVFPYTKVRKFKTEEDCWKFINRNINKHKFGKITTYGNTFKELYARMEYFIQEDRVCYNFDISHVGFMRIAYKDAVVSNHRNNIKVMLPNIYLDNDMIQGHMIAIYHGVKILGSFIDVDIIVPDHSIFYALKTYTGNNRIVKKTQQELAKRLGEFSITIR